MSKFFCHHVASDAVLRQKADFLIVFLTPSLRFTLVKQILSPLPYTLNIKGRLFSLGKPQVMGIVNVTPDSFYSGSRTQDDEAIAARCRTIRDEGATIIDIGAYSSRYGADAVPAEEEMARLRRGLTVVRRECPAMVVSVDTFRADVAKMCVEEYGADIINDISGGTMDHQMFRTVARLGVPYILMHMQGTPQTMQDNPQYADLMRDVFVYFAERINLLHDMGVPTSSSTRASASARRWRTTIRCWPT